MGERKELEHSREIDGEYRTSQATPHELSMVWNNRCGGSLER